MKKLTLITLILFNSILNVNASDTVLLELFTSQGCSSCPPADQVLANLKSTRAEEILPLSFHVSYWDHLGWKDPHAKVKNDNRQKDYVTKLKLRSAYTPQAIIDGKYQVVGSKKKDILHYVKEAAKTPKYKFTLSKKEDKLLVELPKTKLDIEQVAVTLIYYDDFSSNLVKAGENKGHRLGSHNIVTGFETIAYWKGETKTLSKDFPLAPKFVVILQDEKSGTILGAKTSIELEVSEEAISEPEA